MQLDTLLLWTDPLARVAEECMAVDEALLCLADQPVMRCYHWARPSITYGFFDDPLAVKQHYAGDENLFFSRRWTGGGVVDHRYDFPFSLILPHKCCSLSRDSQALYAWLHAALAEVLGATIDCNLQSQEDAKHGRLCFNNPVAYDLVAANGHKVVGGGQRRNLQGTLHQGSMQGLLPPVGWQRDFAARLCQKLATSMQEEPLPGMNAMVNQLLEQKYSKPEWQMARAGKASGHKLD